MINIINIIRIADPSCISTFDKTGESLESYYNNNIQLAIIYYYPTRLNHTLSTLPFSSTYTSNLLVYPNPTHGKVTISFTSNKADDYKIRIVNVIGEVLYLDDKEKFSRKNPCPQKFSKAPIDFPYGC